MGQDGGDGAEAERDNRSDRRDRVLKGAQVAFGGSVLDCVVLDISATGARVRFGIPVPVPEAVTLRLRDGSSYPARRSWARGREVGLEFTGGATAGGGEEQLRLARAALEMLRAADPAGWLKILRAERFFGDEALHRAAEAAEVAHMRLEAALGPHAAGAGHGDRQRTE